MSSYDGCFPEGKEGLTDEGNIQLHITYISKYGRGIANKQELQKEITFLSFFHSTCGF